MTYIKLSFKSETKKAYQLENGSWIPKSILDQRGLTNPYYQVKGWWISTLLDDWVKNKKTIEGVAKMEVKFRDLPKNVIEYWKKYWSGSGSSYSCDMEPRVWGNDCFDGEMSNWF